MLDEYQSQIEALAAQWIDEGQSPRLLRPSRKQFNDPVWRTITLHPLEVAVLDSGMVQRLRFIKQLGVADFVFTGATQTRLEHSIGTVEAIDRLVAAVNAEVSDAVSPAEHRLLRLTALCHDVGHGAMSHVSDNAMKQSEVCQELRLDFQRLNRLGREPALSEIAAYYLVGSPAFKEYLTTAIEATGEHVLPDDPTSLMQRAIVGLSISDRVPQLHELISGPFDADKLDYMTRDALMAGVPVVTDIPRLALKVRAVVVPPDALPRPLAKTVKGGLPSYVLLGIAHSGGRTLDELMLGRILLFDKIYRHHKVRALEAMTAAVLLRLAALYGGHVGVLPLLFSDEQLLDLSMADIANLAGRELTDDEDSSAQTAVAITRRIRQRRLTVRCYAFSLRMPLDPYHNDDHQRSAVLGLMSTASHAAKRAALVAAIAREVRQMVALLGEEPEELPELEALLWLDPPEPSQSVDVFARAYLVTGDGTLLKFRDDYSESKSWADAYLQAKDVGYVFGPASLAPMIYLAAEKVARIQEGLRTPSSMMDYAKQSDTVIDGVRRQLADRGYYDATPPDIRPKPQRLTRADVPMVLETVSERLSGYMGPTAGATVSFIEATRIEGWVRQFESDQLVDAALRAVESIRIIGRSDVVNSVRSFLSDNPAFAGAALCPLGNPKDSSYVATYFSQDVAGGLGLAVTTLESALQTDRPVLFVDDFIGSGRQAVTVLESWLGLEPSFDLREDREALHPDVAERMRARPLGFVYAAGMADGADLLSARAHELHLDASVRIHVTDLPRLTDVTYEEEAQRDAFERACRAIGAQLLRSEGNVDVGSIPDRVLGYGNHGLLVVFPYNIPAQSLTCLWASGTANGFDWIPLMPRRRKT